MAKVDTHIIMVQKGTPNAGKRTAFYRMTEGAGLELSKKVIRPVEDGSNKMAIEAAQKFLLDTDSKKWVPETSAAVEVQLESQDWTTGQHLPWCYPTEAELVNSAHKLVLSWAAANLTHTAAIVDHRAKLAAEGLSSDAAAGLKVQSFSELAAMVKHAPAKKFMDAADANTLGQSYLVTIGGCSGMKRLQPGSNLLISAGNSRNGVKGAYALDQVLVRAACDCSVMQMSCPACTAYAISPRSNRRSSP
jgi:hypothetical protein